MEIQPERKTGTLIVTASAATTAQTGVEMEAMTAAAIAALTIYDMVKSADRFVTVTNVRLLEKSGGASGHWKRPAPAEQRADDEAKPAHTKGKPAAAPTKRARAPRKG